MLVFTHVAVTFLCVDDCEEQTYTNVLQKSKSLHRICICHVKCVVWVWIIALIIVALPTLTCLQYNNYNSNKFLYYVQISFYSCN